MFESGQSPSKLTLAYVLLAHEPAEQIAELVQTLLDADPSAHVVVHYDLNSPAAQYQKLVGLFSRHERAWLVKDRVKCGWGRFGLVDGVVRALRTLRDHKVDCDYVYLLSGSCMPTKPLALLKRFLAENLGMEFIEAHPADWMVDGLREERYQYIHWFSYRTHRNLFEGSWRLQRTLGLKQRLPRRLVARFGPQWWCLTRGTCFAILDFIDRRPAAYRFFKTTWIPDELFFQTMASSIATPARVFGKSLTFFKFTPRKGRPINFYDDHVDLVPQLPCFFARKISPSAHRLRARLAEIAAAPDDGRDFPSLETSSEIFDYEKRVRQQVDDPLPGQLYFGGQAFTRWPASLAQVHRPFVVLHGPPSVTGIVRDHLRQVPGLTLLGRVFRPRSIAFEPLGEAYEGFTAADAPIRDQDPPLYLSRLLERADGLPVIEVSPGDAPLGEGHFLFNSNAVFVSCQPSDPTDEASRRLYWTLAAAANPDSAGDLLLDWNNRSSRQEVPRYADALIEKYSPSEHRKWITETLLGSLRDRPFIRLSWGVPKRATAAEGPASQLATLQEAFGSEITPLVLGLTGIGHRLASIRPLEITQDLPAEWQSYFSGGAGPAAENWRAAFERSNTGYAVLHGPPALTRIVREHLRGTKDIAFLGRIFDPRGRDEGASGSRIAPGDRPRFLTEALARADGFPVLEICLGDEPAGEAYLLHDENALFVSCQPDHSDDDDRQRLFWALGAVADDASPRGLPTAERGKTSLLRVRHEIDDVVGAFAPAARRKTLSGPLFGSGASPQVLRLITGTGERVSAAEPTAHALARFRRALGPAFRPFLRGLADIDAELGAVSVADLTADFPPEWRDYFSTNAAPTFEQWESAMAPVNAPYGVLYGPPAATMGVRTHLAGLPGVRMLGRVFDPDAAAKAAASPQAARETGKRREDRPLSLVRALSGANDFAIIEVCPGDERHGEEFFLSDANALILSCEPDDPGDPDQMALYWALVASGSRAASRELAGDTVKLGHDLGPRQSLEAFVERKVLASHREWFGDAVLHQKDDPRIVRLPWTGEAADERQEQLQARLARLGNDLGPGVAPLVDALAGIEKSLAEQSLGALVEGLPCDWRRLFVDEAETEEKVA